MESALIAGRLAAPAIRYGLGTYGPIIPINTAFGNQLNVQKRRTRGFSLLSESPARKRFRLDANTGLPATAVRSPSLLNQRLLRSRQRGSRKPPSSRKPRFPRYIRRKTMYRRRRTRSRRVPRRLYQRVKKVVLSLKEPRRLLDSVSQATFTCGDGTTRVAYIAHPLSTLTTGSDKNQRDGTQIFIKGFWLRGRIALDQTTNTLKVRIMLLRTRQFADLPAGFTTYGNTTTATTNPTQDSTAGEQNIAMFETSPAEAVGQPSARYVGNASGIDIIDNDYVDVIKAREYWMSPDRTAPFKDIDIYCNINKKWSNQSDFDEGEADQLRTFMGWNYYWVMQVFSNTNANNILVAQDIVGTFDIITYFKDL